MKSTAKKLAVCAAALCLLACGTAVSAAAASPVSGLALSGVAMPWDQDVPAESIEAGSYTANMLLGSSQQLSPVVRPRNSTDSVVFISDDTSILTVSNSGVVQAVGVGTTRKTLCVVGDGYTMQIAGSGVKSTTSELDTMLILTESDQGIEFELDKGKALPCSVRIDLDVSTYTRLYLYNAVSNKWQYLNSYTDGIITADTAGRYLLTNQNLKFANINWTFFIAGGVVVVLIGIAYVVLKKRYWFW